MRRLIPVFIAAVLAFTVTGAYATGGMVEIITDLQMQERAVAAPEPQVEESAPPNGFIIENASVVESGPAAETYTDILPGDAGEPVSRLQARLIQLGYLTESALDGAYGDATASAVHDFKAKCGIADDAHDPAACPADAETQAALFADSAVPYNDPAFPVEIVTEAGIQAKEDRSYLIFRPTIRNNSHVRTITSFTLDCYATDLWGNRVVGETMQYSWTSAKSVAPGATAQAENMTIPERSKIAWLYAAVTKITFADGTSQVPETPFYVGWTPMDW